MSRLAQLERLHAADPADADIPYMLAQEHLRTGDTAAALEWFDRCIALQPDYHYAYYHKARAMTGASDSRGAIAVAQQGLARARAAGNTKATDELSALIAQLEA